MTKRSRSTLPTVAPADPSEQARLTQVVEKLAQEVQLLRIMMDEVQEELADSNFNWEQLKLMRIKFLCEYGN